MAESVNVPYQVVEKLRRKPHVLGLYVLLLAVTGDRSFVRLSAEELACMLGRSRATVFRWLRDLRIAGLLESQRQLNQPAIRRLRPVEGGLT